jgi:S-DNA-T family DNA segregation ATPase FtsK/SpoIIIE
MSFLAPTKHHRANEAVGLLLFTLTALLVLSLVSYNPSDPSFNTSRSAFWGNSVQNWVGEFGSTLADLLLQVFGYPAFILPVICGIFGWKWLRSRQIESATVKAAGLVALLGSSCALCGLVFPDFLTVGWSLKAGGVAGDILAAWLRARFNLAGSMILSLSLLFISLFISTTFSFTRSAAFVRARLGFLGTWRERWHAWQRAREKERERLRLETKLKREGRAELRPDTMITQTVADLKERGPASAKLIPKEPSPRDMDFAEPGPRITEKRVQVEKARIIATGTPDFIFPAVGMLRPPASQGAVNEKELKERAQQLVEKFKEFEVHGQVNIIHPGPVVTTYEFKPEAGIKYSRITNLVNDLCLALKAESVRIDRLPGKSTVGVEVPNIHRETIYLREIIESAEFQGSHSKLTMALGKDIVGKIAIADLAKMPHLLIAGQTGSGKSVAVNAMILSILYKASPDDVKFILVDPKRLELGLYEDIPHLLTPVVTEPKRASNALKWAVSEMENRLKLLATVSVRNIEQYNAFLKKPKTLDLFPEEPTDDRKHLPLIVIVIDELADLMMVASKDVQDSIMRLTQMARAVGIHLIVATQRPSVDVLTGVIKANLPSRISFRVASKFDSRTILDQIGSEHLLGKGDMLFIPPGSSKMVRVHAPYVSEEEIEEIVRHLKSQAKPAYNQTILEDTSEKAEQTEIDGEADEMYEEAVRIVLEMGKASTSTLQRRLRLGYGRAARLIDMMERDGIVGPADGSKPREVLKRRDYFKEMDEERR